MVRLGFSYTDNENEHPYYNVSQFMVNVNLQLNYCVKIHIHLQFVTNCPHWLSNMCTYMYTHTMCTITIDIIEYLNIFLLYMYYYLRVLQTSIIYYNYVYHKYHCDTRPSHYNKYTCISHSATKCTVPIIVLLIYLTSNPLYPFVFILNRNNLIAINYVYCMHYNMYLHVPQLVINSHLYSMVCLIFLFTYMYGSNSRFVIILYLYTVSNVCQLILLILYFLCIYMYNATHTHNIILCHVIMCAYNCTLSITQNLNISANNESVERCNNIVQYVLLLIYVSQLMHAICNEHIHYTHNMLLPVIIISVYITLMVGLHVFKLFRVMILCGIILHGHYDLYSALIVIIQFILLVIVNASLLEQCVFDIHVSYLFIINLNCYFECICVCYMSSIHYKKYSNISPFMLSYILCYNQIILIFTSIAVLDHG